MTPHFFLFSSPLFREKEGAQTFRFPSYGREFGQIAILLLQCLKKFNSQLGEGLAEDVIWERGSKIAEKAVIVIFEFPYDVSRKIFSLIIILQS